VKRIDESGESASELSIDAPSGDAIAADSEATVEQQAEQASEHTSE
jgi:hypothetical protein